MAETVGHTSAHSAQTHRNIREICELEEQELERRTASERLSDAIVSSAGRLWFALSHAVWMVAWIVWNSDWVAGASAFDPFPYSALSTILSIEAIFLTLVILMSQNRASRRADERAHLDLQINLMAEFEATKVLSLLRALCLHHQLPEASDPELVELLARIRPSELAQEISKRLPSDGTVPTSK